MTETLEQITERATREAEVKITYEPPAPSFSNALTDNHLLALAKEAEKTGYIAGVIAEATRDKAVSIDKIMEVVKEWVKSDCVRNNVDDENEFYWSFDDLRERLSKLNTTST